MAAVAGSKGRLEPRPSPDRSMQMLLVAELLSSRGSVQGVARQLLSNRRLREVGVDTNMICNLACQYCYLSDRKEAAGELPLDSLYAKLTELAESGTKLFAFIGKEPLADERAVTTLRRLNELRGSHLAFRTGMVTNGTLVAKRIDQLVEANVSYIDISIDGLTDAENSLRGSAIAGRIQSGIESIIRSPLRERFATATVITGISAPKYPEFVKAMFDRGVVTCFASPVLRFAMSNEVGGYAVSLEHTLRLAESLAEATRDADPCVQVIIDLPYRYTWSLFHDGRISLAEVHEDSFEALFWQLPGSRVFIKLNPFPYSYWRALRITHDGTVILNMDLAAHERYSNAATTLDQISPTVFDRSVTAGIRTMTNFINAHLGQIKMPIYERDLGGQYARNLDLHAAA